MENTKFFHFSQKKRHMEKNVKKNKIGPNFYPIQKSSRRIKIYIKKQLFMRGKLDWTIFWAHFIFFDTFFIFSRNWIFDTCVLIFYHKNRKNYPKQLSNSSKMVYFQQAFEWNHQKVPVNSKIFSKLFFLSEFIGKSWKIERKWDGPKYFSKFRKKWKTNI